MKCTLFHVLLLLVPVTAFSQDFAGKWLIESETPFGRVRTLLELSQVGEKVAGTLNVLSGRSPFSMASAMHQPIHGAQINNKTLTFYIWTGRDEPLKDIYRGTLTDKGEISFEVQRGVGPPRAVPPNPNGGASAPMPPLPARLTAVPIL